MLIAYVCPYRVPFHLYFVKHRPGHYTETYLSLQCPSSSSRGSTVLAKIFQMTDYGPVVVVNNFGLSGTDVPVATIW